MSSILSQMHGCGVHRAAWGFAGGVDASFLYLVPWAGRAARPPRPCLFFGVFMSTLSAFFESAKLPVMSEVVHALIRTLNDPDSSATQVEAIIAKDPALTANLLRLANSAQFGLSRQVLSLDHAITLMGMSRVRALALSTSISTAFPQVPGLDRTAFWKFSMACAGYAQWLAGGAGLDPQQAWLAGMMLRLGELIIGQKSPDALVQ